MLSEEMNSLIKEVEKLRDDSIPIMAVINWSKAVAELEAKLAKLRKDFRAFREARIGHDYITHSEELEAQVARLRDALEEHAEYDMDGKPINWIAEALDA